jgi:hypothetical protein
MVDSLKCVAVGGITLLGATAIPVAAQSWECRGEASSYFSGFDGRGKISGGTDGYVGRYLIRPAVPCEPGLMENEGMLPTHVVISDDFDGILAQFYYGIGTRGGIPIDRSLAGHVVFSINSELGRFILTDVMTYLAEPVFRDPYFEIGYCRKLPD